MALQKFEKDMAIIAALDDQPNDVGGLTAAELKDKFDEGGKAIQDYLNNVFLPALEQLGVETLVQYKSEGIKYVRLNADKVIETSSDGQVWQATGSSGHVIYDGDGNSYPQRSRLKFLNTVISDDGTYTVITGVQGPKGETGATGATGPQGIQGEKGDKGAAWYPNLDGLGNLTFTLLDTTTPPPQYNIRGPQGPQGVQGLQGEVGPRGPQGIQGTAGRQGPQGFQGETGPAGPKGSTGPQGPAGPQGPMGPEGPAGAPGKDGTSLYIEDTYPTLAALRLSFPSGNKNMYYVEEDKNCYIYSETKKDWESVGQLQGPAGPQGPIGPQGEAGPQGPAGSDGATGAQGPQGIQGIQGPEGPEGPQGPQGLQGIPGKDGKSPYQIAVEEGYTGTESDFNSALVAVPNKVDRVQGGTAGNFASLSETGDLQDSGKSPNDFAPAPLYFSLKLYVNSTSGSDSNPGTEEQPFKTIMAALNSVPKNLGGHNVTINVSSGDYDEEIKVGCFFSGGNLIIQGVNGQTNLLKGVHVYGNSVIVSLRDLNIKGAYIGSSITASKSMGLEILRCNVDCSSAISYGLNAIFTNISIYSSSFSNYNGNYGAIVADGCTLLANGLSGDNNKTGIIAGSDSSGQAGIVIIGRNTMQATTKYKKVRGGAIIENGVLI